MPTFITFSTAAPRRFAMLGLAVAMLVTAPAGAWAQGGDSPSLTGALERLGAQPADIEVLTAVMTADGTGDTFRYAVAGAEPATHDAGGSDILRHTAGPVVFEGFGPSGGPLPCGPSGDLTVLCQSDAQAQGPHWLFAAEFAGPVDPGRTDLNHSVGFPILRAGGNPWQAQGDFVWDTFQGTDAWFTAERAPGQDWTLQGVEGGSFATLDVAAWAVLDGNVMMLAVPAGPLGFPITDATDPGEPAGEMVQIDPPSTVAFSQGLRMSRVEAAQFGVRFGPTYGVHVHIHDGTFGANESDTSSVDSSPDTNTDTRRGPDGLAQSGTTAVTLPGDPAVITDEEDTESNNVGGTTPREGGQQSSEESGSNLLPFLFVIILIAGAGIAVGTQTRNKPEPYCDWGAYWSEGELTKKGATVIREPKGHECCYYVLKATSRFASDNEAGDKNVHLLHPTAAASAWGLQEVFRSIAGSRAGLGAKIESRLRWRSRRKSRPSSLLGWSNKTSKPLKTKHDVSGIAATGIQARLIYNKHCLGDKIHRFKTDTITSSGAVEVDIKCEHDLVNSGCDNDFNATVKKLAIGVNGTDFEAYEVSKKESWSTTGAKGAKWKVDITEPTVSGGVSLEKEVSKSWGPFAAKAKVSGGVGVSIDPAGNHNPDKAIIPIEGASLAGGTGTFDPAYELNFAHAYTFEVENELDEWDYTGAESLYSNKVEISLGVQHDAVWHGETNADQHAASHRENPGCCVTSEGEGPEAQPCQCKPAITFTLRGKDSRPHAGGMVPAKEFKFGPEKKERYVDAIIKVDEKEWALMAPRDKRKHAWKLFGKGRPAKP